jgi:Cu-Zn family superoxide dismutase
MQAIHLRGILTAAALCSCIACKTKEQTPLHKQIGDQSGAVGSADPSLQNGQRLPPGTIFQRAEAKFQAPQGKDFSGNAKLEEVTGGVRIQVSIHNAPPSSKLAVHVDETGDCGADSGTHWNPRNTPHGLPEAADHHLGDLGNVPIDEHGTGELLILTAGGNLRNDDPLSFLRRSIVVEDAADDGKPPRGGHGKPLGCAPIEPS